MLYYLITFLVGVFIGAGGKYLADKYTDKRRGKEYVKSEIKRFKSIKEKMPFLINEMKEDLLGDGLVRDFFVIESKRLSLNCNGQYFVYNEEKHDNLISKINILENEEYINDITPGNALKYRMSEDFVELVLKIK